MTPEGALLDVARRLARLGVAHALVGGLAVSIRAEVRFTRDVDLAIVVDSDRALEGVTRTLAGEGYSLVAVVEQDERRRVAIARLRAPSGVVVDLRASSSGIEREIVAAATPTAGFADVPVAQAEHLLAMKVLSMRDARFQDRLDARNLLEIANVDVAIVETALDLIASRGYARGQDLRAKLATLLAEIAHA